MKSLQEVSDLIERDAKCLLEQLVNLTKKSFMLTIVKDKGIVTDVIIKGIGGTKG